MVTLFRKKKIFNDISDKKRSNSSKKFDVAVTLTVAMMDCELKHTHT